jgi:hypothetical protein
MFFADGASFNIEMVQALNAGPADDIASSQQPAGRLSAIHTRAARKPEPPQAAAGLAHMERAGRLRDSSLYQSLLTRFLDQGLPNCRRKPFTEYYSRQNNS